MGNGRRRARTGRLRRTAVLAVVLAATVTTTGSAMASTSTAAAAQPVPLTLTVDPASGVRHGDTVEVTAAGFGSLGVMGIFQCPTVAAHPGSGQCEMLQIVLSLAEPLVLDLAIREVLRIPTPAGAQAHRCGATPGDCALMAWSPQGTDAFAVAPLDIVQGPLAFGQAQYEEGSPVQAYVVAPPGGGAHSAPGP